MMRPPVIIRADITKLDWSEVSRIQKEKYGELFTVILMDPPWDIQYYLKYPTMQDKLIRNIPINDLQESGYLFVWVVNSKEQLCRKWIEEELKYDIVDKVVWVKITKNNKLVKGSGVTLRHSEETCILARKGNVKKKSKLHKVNNVIVSAVRG